MKTGCHWNNRGDKRQTVFLSPSTPHATLISGLYKYRQRSEIQGRSDTQSQKRGYLDGYYLKANFCDRTAKQWSTIHFSSSRLRAARFPPAPRLSTPAMLCYDTGRTDLPHNLRLLQYQTLIHHGDVSLRTSTRCCWFLRDPF